MAASSRERNARYRRAGNLAYESWKMRNAGRKRHSDDIVTELLRRARWRAAKKNLPFSLSYEDIDLPTYCPVLGLKLEPLTSEAAPSLDRIIPKLGYVPGNVLVVSRRANRIKNDATVEELQEVAGFYKKFLGQR